MVNQEAFKNTAKQAFAVADFSHKLTQRVILKSAKKLIDYGFSYSNFRSKYGHDFSFPKSKRLAKHLGDNRLYMEKVVTDSLDEVEKLSYDTAKKHLGKVPDKRWDKEAFLAILIYGATYKQRVSKYTEQLKNEIEAFIRVGQEEKMTADGVLHWYAEKIEDPKTDDLIISAISAGKIKMEGLSSYRAFRNLNDDMIVRGFAKANAHNWLYAEAKFIVAQQDSSTCDNCSDIDGKVFPIDEDVIPMHGSCRCIEVPIMNVPY